MVQETGNTVTVTRRGVVVAQVVPPRARLGIGSAVWPAKERSWETSWPPWTLNGKFSNKAPARYPHFCVEHPGTGPSRASPAGPPGRRGYPIVVVPRVHLGVPLLAEKGRLVLPPDAKAWLKKALRAIGAREAPLTGEVSFTSREIQLPHQDPADRFLAATAAVLRTDSGDRG